MKMARIARMLGKSLRTCWRLLQGEPKRQGRPRKEISSEEAKSLDAMLEARGGKISIENLKYRLRTASRRALGEYKKAWVRRYKAHKRAMQNRLEWLKSGKAWGLDGAFAKRDIGGKGRRFLVVRDVASKYTLGAIPAPERSRDVIRFLKDLFARYGFPLVLKHDNGPGFIAKKTQRFMKKRGIATLLSPPWYPQYNGATERGMQDIKGFAEVSATLSGHPGNWLQEDLGRAMTMANEREVKKKGQWESPRDRFDQRKSIGREERQAFLELCGREIQGERAQLQGQLTQKLTKKKRKRLLAKATRRGVSQALVKGGYLKIEEGRISQPVSAVNRATFSEG